MSTAFPFDLSTLIVMTSSSNVQTIVPDGMDKEMHAALFRWTMGICLVLSGLTLSLINRCCEIMWAVYITVHQAL